MSIKTVKYWNWILDWPFMINDHQRVQYIICRNKRINYRNKKMSNQNFLFNQIWKRFLKHRQDGMRNEESSCIIRSIRYFHSYFGLRIYGRLVFLFLKMNKISTRKAKPSNYATMSRKSNQMMEHRPSVSMQVMIAHQCLHLFISSSSFFYDFIHYLRIFTLPQAQSRTFIF